MRVIWFDAWWLVDGGEGLVVVYVDGDCYAWGQVDVDVEWLMGGVGVVFVFVVDWWVVVEWIVVMEFLS